MTSGTFSPDARREATRDGAPAIDLVDGESLCSLLKELVGEDSQFIIATHSPILMAFPGASILSFDGPTIREVPYGEVEGVALLRSFLENPGVFLRHL